MIMKKNRMILKTVPWAIMVCFIFSSCEKYLDIKPDKKMIVPKTLNDFKALLDEYPVMNQESTPSIGEIGSDDYFLIEDDFGKVPVRDQIVHLWAKENFEVTDNRVSDWFLPYQLINYSNIVLEGLDKISASKAEQEEWNYVEGRALFFRAWGHYQLSQLFCADYDVSKEMLGIPLRLTSDIEGKVKRATLEQTYDQILNDLNQSIPLLETKAILSSRPSKAASYALLARIYLQMNEYNKALESSTTALKINSSLINYNEVNTTLSYPFTPFNEEVLFHSTMVYKGIFASGRMQVDSELFDLYEHEDLRKSAFFWNNKGKLTFKGSYDGGVRFFSGLTTAELYLISAECHVRLGNVEDSRNILLSFLKNRYKDGVVTLDESNEKESLLHRVLSERRKEFAFRGVRWSDLRRLNKHVDYQKILTRKIGNEVFTLLPNSNRYTYQIPNFVIDLNQMEQNNRD